MLKRAAMESRAIKNRPETFVRRCHRAIGRTVWRYDPAERQPCCGKERPEATLQRRPHSRLAGAQLWSTEMLRAFVFEAAGRLVLFIACIVVWGAMLHSVAL
jgi:hypothetical protein